MSECIKVFGGCTNFTHSMFYCVFISFLAVPVLAGGWTRCNIGYFLEKWVKDFNKEIATRCNLRVQKLTMEYHCYQESDAYRYTKGDIAKAGIEQNMFAALIRRTWSGRKLARLAVEYWAENFGLCTKIVNGSMRQYGCSYNDWNYNGLLLICSFENLRDFLEVKDDKYHEYGGC